jgi:hypothetical protein
MNEAMTIADLVKSGAVARHDRKRREEEARDAIARKANHDAVYRFIWPAQYVRRTPEKTATPYFQRLNAEVARYAMSGLGVHKIAAAIGVPHRTVRRILRPGREIVTVRYAA